MLDWFMLYLTVGAVLAAWANAVANRSTTPLSAAGFFWIIALWPLVLLVAVFGSARRH